jgi:hypothetical protein
LKAAPSQLDAWIRGQATMPDRKLLVLIDLIDSLGALGDKP